MTLEDEITEAQKYYAEPPKNEWNTRNWVISPLLHSSDLGYERRDIESETADSTGAIPDYTLLPNYPSATYYLEAKAWNVLLDTHVRQALNYTNHNGKRFVILTNGQNWRLYDNAIQGILADKLVSQAELSDTPQITLFLQAISKSEVLGGSFERIVVEGRQRKLQQDMDRLEQLKHEEELRAVQKRQMEIRDLLNTALPKFLGDPTSELIVLMTLCLSDQKEAEGISPEVLATWFSEKLLSADHKDNSTLLNQVQAVAPTSSQQASANTLTLKELQGRPIDGKKSRLIGLQILDGNFLPVNQWVRLTIHIVSWLLVQPSVMPLPFESGNRNRWFLNQFPEHKQPSLRGEFESVSVHGKTVYMDKDRSAVDLLAAIYAICLAMQIDPGNFRITVNF